MPNIAALLKSEISRLARRGVRAEVEALRKASSGYQSDIASLKKQVRSLQTNCTESREAQSALPGRNNLFRTSGCASGQQA
jgi:hypothetical protein